MYSHFPYFENTFSKMDWKSEMSMEKWKIKCFQQIIFHFVSTTFSRVYRISCISKYVHPLMYCSVPKRLSENKVNSKSSSVMNEWISFLFLLTSGPGTITDQSLLRIFRHFIFSLKSTKSTDKKEKVFKTFQILWKTV